MIIGMNTMIIGVLTFAFTQLRIQLPVLVPMMSRLRYEIQSPQQILLICHQLLYLNVLLISFVRCQCKLLLRKERLHLMSSIVIENVVFSRLATCMHQFSALRTFHNGEFNMSHRKGYIRRQSLKIQQGKINIWERGVL